MKRYLKNYILTVDKVEEAIYDCLRRKWKRTDVSYFLAAYYECAGKNIHERAKICKEYAGTKETRYMLYETISRAAYSMYLEIENRSIELRPISYQTRYDRTSEKMREIGISTIKQQVYDYLVVNACKKMFMAKIGHFQCASIPKRGQVFGKKRIERWIRKDYKNCRYYYKCDIKKYYPSVNIDNLKKFIRRDIKCDDIFYVINFLLGTYKDGLCIGSYLSQYLANYYISYAYHHITENSYSFRAKKNGEKVRINNASHVLFYMDDIIIFSSSVKLLGRVVRDFTHYIHDVLFLKIKEGDGIFRTRTTRIDMMGYCISIKNTIVRHRIFRRIRRLFLRVKGRSKSLSLHISRRILSHYGWLKHSDLYLFCKRFKIKTIVSRAKKVVSFYDKRNIFGKTGQIQLLQTC